MAIQRFPRRIFRDAMTLLIPSGFDGYQKPTTTEETIQNVHVQANNRTHKNGDNTEVQLRGKVWVYPPYSTPKLDLEVLQEQTQALGGVLTCMITNKAGTTRIICVPEGSTTYTTVTSYAASNSSITVSTTNGDCLQIFEYTVQTDITENGWTPDWYNPLVAAVPIEPVQNASAKLSIDWGDGTAVELQPSSVTEANLIHTYASAGTYQITVGSEKWSDYRFMAVEFCWDSDRTSDNPRIQTFREKLVSIDEPIPAFSNDNMIYWFYNCIFLTSVNAHLFDNMTAAASAHRCFAFCDRLSSIPETLFAKNTAITDFSECFRNCINVTSIPSNLFANNVAATDFGGCFLKCAEITSIPAGLFAANTAATNFNSCFNDCDSLQSIPSDVFATNTAATSFYRCFSYCSSLNSFTIHIGSSLVSSANYFVDKKSGVTRTIYVPSGSNTQTTFNAIAPSLGVTVTGE